MNYDHIAQPRIACDLHSCGPDDIEDDTFDAAYTSDEQARGLDHIIADINKPGPNEAWLASAHVTLTIAGWKEEDRNA